MARRPIFDILTMTHQSQGLCARLLKLRKQPSSRWQIGGLTGLHPVPVKASARRRSSAGCQEAQTIKAEQARRICLRGGIGGYVGGKCNRLLFRRRFSLQNRRCFNQKRGTRRAEASHRRRELHRGIPCLSQRAIRRGTSPDRAYSIYPVLREWRATL
jgi:hypothetical protein